MSSQDTGRVGSRQHIRDTDAPWGLSEDRIDQDSAARSRRAIPSRGVRTLQQFLGLGP